MLANFWQYLGRVKTSLGKVCGRQYVYLLAFLLLFFFFLQLTGATTMPCRPITCQPSNQWLLLVLFTWQQGVTCRAERGESLCHWIKSTWLGAFMGSCINASLCCGQVYHKRKLSFMIVHCKSPIAVCITFPLMAVKGVSSM